MGAFSSCPHSTSPANVRVNSGQKGWDSGATSPVTHTRAGGTTAPEGLEAPRQGSVFPLASPFPTLGEGNPAPGTLDVLWTQLPHSSPVLVGQPGLGSSGGGWNCPSAGKWGSEGPQGLGRGCGVRDMEQLLSHLASVLNYKTYKPLWCSWLCSACSPPGIKTSIPLDSLALKPPQQPQLQLPFHGDLASFPFPSRREGRICSGIWC